MRRRVLSIQGGGVNGLFAAKLLALIEEELEQDGQNPRVGRYFDLVSGTSTGGLIALGLALEIPALTIVKLYQEKSSCIFPRWRHSALWKASRRPKRWPIYQSAPLVEELQSVFKYLRLGNATSRLVIPTFNQSADSVHLFKTAHHKNFVRDYKLHAWDVAAATAAAPFYFPPHKMESGASFLDGGVWANNPILVALGECIQYCAWDRSQLDVLSISGVRDVIDVSSWQKLVGLPGAIVHSQVKGSIASAKTLLGDVNGAMEPHGRLIDYASEVPSGAFAMDDANSVDDLVGQAEALFRKRSTELMETFFSQPAEVFIPEYSL